MCVYLDKPNQVTNQLLFISAVFASDYLCLFFCKYIEIWNKTDFFAKFFKKKTPKINNFYCKVYIYNTPKDDWLKKQL